MAVYPLIYEERSLKATVGFSAAPADYEPAKWLSSKNNKVHVARALVDTGATGTCISPEIVESLGLRPKGKGLTNTAGGFREERKFFVVISLLNVSVPSQNELSFSDIVHLNKKIEVLELSAANWTAFEAILGMDVLRLGSLSITPSVGSHFSI